MSLASQWGEFLFPGVTVLTRHPLHLRLLQLEYLKVWKKTGDSREAFRHLRKRSVHRKLEKLARTTLNEDSNKPETKMTYWQRYGSMFKYFKLDKATKALSITDIRSIVYSPTIPRKHRLWCIEDPVMRRRRVSHVAWYESFTTRLPDDPDEQLDCLLRDEPAWFTGSGFRNKVPDPVKLSRQLEYAFLIWQTYFEASTLLLLRGKPIVRTPAPGSLQRRVVIRKVRELVQTIRSGEDSDTQDRKGKSTSEGALIALCRVLLAAHRDLDLKSWERAVAQSIGEDFTKLYNGRSLATFASAPASKLFDELYRLHTFYCEEQHKPHAKYVESDDAKYRAVRLPQLSVRFQRSQWGLFSYRLEAAVGFKNHG